MESVNSSNKNCDKSQKMTLKGYYKGLPQRNAPRLDFLKEVANRCGVTITTARNWCLYGIKPMAHEHVEVLVELTGISENDLWGA